MLCLWGCWSLGVPSSRLMRGWATWLRAPPGAGHAEGGQGREEEGQEGKERGQGMLGASFINVSLHSRSARSVLASNGALVPGSSGLCIHPYHRSLHRAARRGRATKRRQAARGPARRGTLRRRAQAERAARASQPRRSARTSRWVIGKGLVGGWRWVGEDSGCARRIDGWVGRVDGWAGCAGTQVCSRAQCSAPFFSPPLFQLPCP